MRRSVPHGVLLKAFQNGCFEVNRVEVGDASGSGYFLVSSVYRLQVHVTDIDKSCSDSPKYVRVAVQDGAKEDSDIAGPHIHTEIDAADNHLMQQLHEVLLGYVPVDVL